MKKIAVVTGASSGIGKAIYEGLADSFDRVVGISRHGPDLYIDLRIPDISRILELELLRMFWGECHLLVNAAGIMPLEENRGRMIFDVNFWGAYNMIKTLKPIFADGACIINIASISGMVNDPDLPIYSASKAALISLTKSLAKRYASNIRVNCISPGFFYPTNLVPEEPPKELIEKIPLRRYEHPEALVPVVKMIYETKYMTGANIVVDGGASC